MKIKAKILTFYSLKIKFLVKKKRHNDENNTWWMDEGCLDGRMDE